MRPTTRRRRAEGAILLKDHILDKKILDMDDHEVEVVYDVKLALQNGKLYASEVDFSRYRLLRRIGLKKLANWHGQAKQGRHRVLDCTCSRCRSISAPFPATSNSRC